MVPIMKSNKDPIVFSWRGLCCTGSRFVPIILEYLLEADQAGFRGSGDDNNSISMPNY